MVSLDSTQLPGPPAFTVIRSGEPGPVSPIEIPSSRSLSKVTVCSAVGARCARIQVGTAICTKMTTARVTAIAGSVRRSTAPRVAPSTTANTAYPTGTMPRIANVTGVRCDGRLPRVLLSAPSSGCDHQVTAKVSRPTAAAAARVVTPSLVASHRVRVTDWVQASRCVPASSSRATSGAPQNTPMIAGATATTMIAA